MKPHVRSKSVAIRALVLSLAALLPVMAATPAHAGSKGNELLRGIDWENYLNRGDWIERSLPDFGNETVRLVMQNDGNLVLHAADGRVCWASNTVGRGDRAVYQEDGNFVIYQGSQATWASNTPDSTGSRVDINARGRLYVGWKAISGECHT
ncbi:hypothetical protein ACFYYH_22365 [Streptomyces sp. NPDC002018]|uniref:hypothetical protein n=1 Tax=Streptomyces sp. NPDC002018 TaxID=3364629 RepID=UPI0036B9ACEB